MGTSIMASIRGRVKGLNKLQRDLLNTKKIRKAIKAEVEAIAEEFLGKIKQNFFDGGPSDDALNVRTGKLKNAIGYKIVTRTSGSFRGIPEIRYGVFKGAGKKKFNQMLAKFKKGGTIKPKSASTLAVPVGPRALGGNGSTKFSARRAVRAPYSASAYPGRLKSLPVRSGGDVVARLVDYDDLAANNWDQRGIQAEYLLMRKVKMPKKNPLGAAAKKYRGDIKLAMTEIFIKVLSGKR
jgi:hypothetical protein